MNIMVGLIGICAVAMLVYYFVILLKEEKE